MIKKRETKAQEKDFIEGVGAVASSNLEPRAPRTFKSLTIPMNEHEYNQLVKLAKEYEQSYNGLIRYALKQLERNTN